MQAMSLTLLYLGSVSFFGLEAKLKLRLNKWDPNLTTEPPLHPQDTQQPHIIPGLVHLRSRRQITLALAALNEVRLGCRLGTCHTQTLADMLYRAMEKAKLECAPKDKIEGYGRRRRRRDLGDTFAALFTRSLGAQQRAATLH